MMRWLSYLSAHSQLFEQAVRQIEGIPEEVQCINDGKGTSAICVCELRVHRAALGGTLP